MAKKVYKQERFAVMTKKSNCGFLTKNLVTFKNKMGWRIKNFNIFRVHRKIRVLGGGVTKNQCIGEIV